MKPTVGSLFSGIGGFELGFERAGFETVWQVEIDDYCRRVLERHFPRAERFGDIRECGAHNLKPVDIICGGFPCQDISKAGKGEGITGARSGLYREMLRVIRVLGPRCAVLENVAALLGRGLGAVLGELAEIGYDAEWFCLESAIHLGHPRERIFIVAYPHGAGLSPSWEPGNPAFKKTLIFPSLAGIPRPQPPSSVVRSVHGIPRRMDRIAALGNAVVPQITQWIAERIKAVMEA